MSQSYLESDSPGPESVTVIGPGAVVQVTVASGLRVRLTVGLGARRASARSLRFRVYHYRLPNSLRHWHADPWHGHSVTVTVTVTSESRHVVTVPGPRPRGIMIVTGTLALAT